jgi:hypothetical protein
MTAEDRSALRPGLARILEANLDTESKTDAILGLFERLLPGAEAPPPNLELPKLVGVEYVAKRLGVGRARAYEIAQRLPGRVDTGDSRFRFSKAVLDSYFASGGEAIAKRAKRGSRK